METNSKKPNLKFKDGNETEDQIINEVIKDSNEAVVKNVAQKVPFKAEIAYAALYPYGLRCSYQYVSVNIIFDGSTYMLSPGVKKFIEDKINKKAINEVRKRNTYGKPENKKIGEYNVG